MTTDYERHFAGFFDRAADNAREIALRYFRRDIPVSDKDDSSPVTEADREIERDLRTLIGKTYPDHGIIGEEYGEHNAGAEFVWVIDPIDGTKSFITGRPQFGTIVGLLHEGRPVVGLIEQAFTRERWFGVADELATHNGKPIRVAPHRTLREARLCTGPFSMFEDGQLDNYTALCRAVKCAQYNGECYAYGLLAMGWLDLVMERGLKIHDVAGVVPIVTGAGGFAGDWELKAVTRNFGGAIVAASARALAQEAVAAFERRPTKSG
jgi:inositol-phosphate phosphatase/L-galactose 1-phosphate phosphatase/histidinol-phosphatase